MTDAVTDDALLHRLLDALLHGRDERGGDDTTLDLVDELKSLTPAAIEARLPHPRSLLPELPSVTVDEQIAGRLRNGMQVNVPEFSRAPLVKVFAGPRDLLGIGRRIAGTLIAPTVVLV